jgi:hypothetical protein
MKLLIDNLELLGMIATALVVGVPVWVANRARAPRPAEDGGVVLRDQEDTALGFLMVLPAYLFIAAFGLGGATLIVLFGKLHRMIDAHGYHGGAEGLMMAVMTLFFGLIGLAAIYKLFARLWTMVRLAAGELHAPAWPLPGGEVVTLRYSRAVRGEAALNSLMAALVLYRVHREARRSGKSTTYETVYREQERIVLDDGRARLHDRRLEATWEVQVPVLPPTQHPIAQVLGEGFTPMVPVLERLPIVSHLVEMAPRLEWRLEVQADFEGLPDDDSVFPLSIAGGEVTTRVPQAEDAPNTEEDAANAEGFLSRFGPSNL